MKILSSHGCKEQSGVTTNEPEFRLQFYHSPHFVLSLIKSLSFEFFDPTQACMLARKKYMRKL